MTQPSGQIRFVHVEGGDPNPPSTIYLWPCEQCNAKCVGHEGPRLTEIGRGVSEASPPSVLDDAILAEAARMLDELTDAELAYHSPVSTRQEMAAAIRRRIATGLPHEVRFDDGQAEPDGTIDEVVGSGVYHAEMMDDNALWIQLGPDAFSVSARGKLRFVRSGPAAPAWSTELPAMLMYRGVEVVRINDDGSVWTNDDAPEADVREALRAMLADHARFVRKPAGQRPSVDDLVTIIRHAGGEKMLTSTVLRIAHAVHEISALPRSALSSDQTPPSVCDCEDWSPQTDKINAPIMLAQARNPNLTGTPEFAFKPWQFCPWCGKTSRRAASVQTGQEARNG